jgi:tetratricopeptide (TPR) repeat protein
VPALVNLGSLRFRDHNIDDALAFYERAQKLAPHDPYVLLGLARVNQELRNYDAVRQQYDELKTLSPELANEFGYLQPQGEEATRAADAGRLVDIVPWEEEK